MTLVLEQEWHPSQDYVTIVLRDGERTLAVRRISWVEVMRTDWYMEAWNALREHDREAGWNPPAAEAAFHRAVQAVFPGLRLPDGEAPDGPAEPAGVPGAKQGVPGTVIGDVHEGHEADGYQGHRDQRDQHQSSSSVTGGAPSAADSKELK